MPKRKTQKPATVSPELIKLNERLDMVRAQVQQFMRDMERVAANRAEEEAHVAEAEKSALDRNKYKKQRRTFLCFMANQHGIDLPTDISPAPSRTATPKLTLALT